MVVLAPIFFVDSGALRKWYEEHQAETGELSVGFYKKGSGLPGLTWPESVDVALCFGWIDGIRKNIDERSYKIRFTPRRVGSIWSAANIRRVPELIEAGLMRAEGLRAFEARVGEKSAIYSYEQKTEALLEDSQLLIFRSNEKAWSFFVSQAPWYRRTLTYWVTSAKREETRMKRLATLIASSERHIRLR